MHELHELGLSDERWPLLGFTTAEEWSEWVRPTTKTLFDSLGPFHRAFLRELASKGEVDIEGFVLQGMPRGIAMEMFNRLARDKWAYLSEGRIRATELSRKFIAKQLAMCGDPTE